MDLSGSEMEPMSPALAANSLPLSHQGSPCLPSFEVPQRSYLSIPKAGKRLYQDPRAFSVKEGEPDFLDSDKYTSLLLKLLLCPGCGDTQRDEGVVLLVHVLLRPDSKSFSDSETKKVLFLGSLLCPL